LFFDDAHRIRVPRRCRLGLRKPRVTREKDTFSDKVISVAHFLQEQGSVMAPRLQLLRQISGFTLIEILVVLLIIGVILAGIAVKAFPDERRVLRQEADRLSLLLEQARDQAFISGRSIAWSAQKDGYTFWGLNAQRQWEAITGDQILRARKLPPSMKVTALYVNQFKVPPSERLVFSPSGLNPSFTATLALQDRYLHLASDSQGRIQIHDE
jgi:general secretion pathway protein H